MPRRRHHRRRNPPAAVTYPRSGTPSAEFRTALPKLNSQTAKIRDPLVQTNPRPRSGQIPDLMPRPCHDEFVTSFNTPTAPQPVFAFLSAMCFATNSARTSSLRWILLLQELDALLFGLVVTTSFGLERCGPVPEELLPPTVETPSAVAPARHRASRPAPVPANAALA